MKLTSMLMAMSLFVAFAGNANARIGETLWESIRRYGEPIGSGHDVVGKLYLFRKGEYSIKIQMDPMGKTWLIIYTKDSKLSDNEVKNLLQIEGHNNWHCVNNDFWYDHELSASRSTYKVMIATDACLKALTQAENNAQKGL
jgi:hypothetical protein